MRNRFLSGLLLTCVLGVISTPSVGADRTFTRLFWQDSASNTVRWGDLKKGKKWSLQAAVVAGFPQLDGEKQSMVQMQVSEGIVLTGVRDTEGGQFSSGWVAIESGTVLEPHGDHAHWRYKASPRVLNSVLNDQQGNPAHVYNYGGTFYLANDKLNGVTIIHPSRLRGAKATTSATEFIRCGGGHITIAAVAEQVCYGTWIDREGKNLGRVDVVGLGRQTGRGYSFALPSGGVHGATTNSGKIFFAPSDGICWVTADLKVTGRTDSVQVEYLSLGEDSRGNPNRTGAFANHRHYVIFTTGRGGTLELCLLDARSHQPSVKKIKLPTAEGTSVTTPVGLRTGIGEDYALLFEESASGEAIEKLHAIALDPNRDGDFSDATLAASLAIGPSLIEGHGGHHELAPAGRRHVVVTNPGDGSLWVISTGNWSVEEKLSVGGVPSRLTSIGGE
jgi:hypothetical protein